MQVFNSCYTKTSTLALLMKAHKSKHIKYLAFDTQLVPGGKMIELIISQHQTCALNRNCLLCLTDCDI